jgi:hypothetical protein
MKDILMKTFLLDIDLEIKLEVTIWAKGFEKSIYYYAKYVNTNINDYKNRGAVEYTEEISGKTVYYKNLNNFENDLRKTLTSSSTQSLKSQI